MTPVSFPRVHDLTEVGAPTFKEALRYGTCRVFHASKLQSLKARGLATAVGRREGGFAPNRGSKRTEGWC
ncbi:MAG: hypothetical protein ACLRPC_07295 [Streptococcus sp.]